MLARRTKGRVYYNTFSEQQKCHVTNIYPAEEKQKYHITFFCKKNKSIILHHALPNTPENVFLLAFVLMKLELQWTNCQTKYRTILQVKEEHRRFIWLALKWFIARKMVTQSLTKYYLIFSSAWLPYGMPRYQVFRLILFIRHRL